MKRLRGQSPKVEDQRPEGTESIVPDTGDFLATPGTLVFLYLVLCDIKAEPVDKEFAAVMTEGFFTGISGRLPVETYFKPASYPRSLALRMLSGGVEGMFVGW